MGLPVLWAVLVGVVGSIHPGVIVTLGTLSTRPEHRAVGMGIFYSLFFAGGTIGPALCGRAADLYGSPAGGLLAAAVIALLASRCTCCTGAWRGVRCCRPWWPGSRAEKRSAAFSPGGGRCAFPP